MKIVYCIHSVSNSGGMESVICNKVNYLIEKCGHEVYILTLEQKNRPIFFPFSDKVKFIDLGINYCDASNNVLLKCISVYFKNRRYCKRLTEILKDLRADIVISLYHHEMSFITKIRDGSAKILEFHFSKYYNIYNYQKLNPYRWLYWLKLIYEERKIERFDSFVVLTNEDRRLWGNKNNIRVIPNACWNKINIRENARKNVIVAVGRICHQKGFDLLLEIWEKIAAQHTDWVLELWGGGDKEAMLNRIKKKGIEHSFLLCGVTKDLELIYSNKAFLVSTSRYEGMPMVLLEAISFGLPVISFEYECGPRDIITDGVDGILVKNGDVDLFVKAMGILMNDAELRTTMGCNALNKYKKFLPTPIMEQWNNLFDELYDSNGSKN